MTSSPISPHDILLHRHPQNPILTAADWPYTVNTVFNPGATRLQNGETLLLCRVENCSGHSHLTVARSANGVDGWRITTAPALPPADCHIPEEELGAEDSRITYVPELGQYVVAYAGVSPGGAGVALALTEDFREFTRLGVILPPEDKDAALFPHRIGENWAIIHRPITPAGSHMWVSYSPDLRHWGSHKVMLRARHGTWWDANKIGLSTPPIETPEGWLVFYHGAKSNSAGCLYRVGVALFDLHTPERCLLRGDSWILAPEMDYERFGDVGYVVFPCGVTIQDDNDTLYVYYGAADTSIALATGSIRMVLAWLHEHGKPDYLGTERRRDYW